MIWRASHDEDTANPADRTFFIIDRNCRNMISWGIAGPSSRVTVFHPYCIVRHYRTMLSNPSTNIIYEICPQLSHEFDLFGCGRGKVAHQTNGWGGDGHAIRLPRQLLHVPGLSQYPAGQLRVLWVWCYRMLY